MFQLFDDEARSVTLIEAKGDRPAVVLRVRPIDRELKEAAHAKVRELPEADRDARGYRAFCAHLLRETIVGWEGIGDAKGRPIPVSPHAVELFLRDPVLGPLAEEKVIHAWLTEDREKNGSSRSPRGTSAGATAARPTARTARPTAKTAPTSKTR